LIAVYPKRTKFMKYRGIEYTVVQGIERGVWPWSALVTNLLIIGNAPNRLAAVAAAERAINKALAPVRRRLHPLDDEDV
jgi:hypothetical protein